MEVGAIIAPRHLGSWVGLCRHSCEVERGGGWSNPCLDIDVGKSALEVGISAACGEVSATTAPLQSRYPEALRQRSDSARDVFALADREQLLRSPNALPSKLMKEIGHLPRREIFGFGSGAFFGTLAKTYEYSSALPTSHLPKPQSPSHTPKDVSGRLFVRQSSW